MSGLNVMIKNYFKLIVRNLQKRSLFTFLNVMGLAIGLASVLVILSFVQEELSYDKFHSKHDRLYRITLDWLDDGKRSHIAAVEPPLTEALAGKISGIERITRVFPIPALVSVDKQNKTKEILFCFADSVFFDLFDFEFIQGDKNTALTDPLTVVLTESKAIEYFGTTEVVGKDVHYETDREEFIFHITGVIKDFPQQSHFKADFLASFHSLDEVMPWYNGWYYPQMHTYLLAQEGMNEQELETQIRVEVRKSHPPQVKDGERTYYLQKVTDIHLNSHLDQEWQANSSMGHVYLFGTIAIFILIIASINFMNLSTAQAATRAKEVGLRKVMGAYRQQLIIYFLGESFFITVISFLCGFALAEWVLIGGLNKMLGRQLSLDFIFEATWLPFIGISVLLIAGASGIYPAFFLSRYKPVQSLKGVVDHPGHEITLRKGLVVFQFMISSILLIFTWIVLDQNDFMLNKDLGFDKDHVVAIRLNDSEAKMKYQVFKNSLVDLPEIQSVSLSSALPGNNEFFGFSVRLPSMDTDLTIQTLGVDEDYLRTYGIDLLTGRDFSQENKADEEGAFIINRAAAKYFQWDDPVGRELTFIRYSDKKEERKGKVIGLVDDFHFQSLYHKVEPLLIYINRHIYYSDYLSVRFHGTSPREAVNLLKKKWEAFIPDKPLEIVFMDDQLDQFYQGELRRANVFSSFAGLSILVSCLGLFGLAAFSMQQKRREIGIRKVMGASMIAILKVLSGQFFRLILIANFMAWPVAWYASSIWLENFAYHISPGVEIFIFSTAGTLVLALLTICVQTLRTAGVNPVETLREA